MHIQKKGLWEANLAELQLGPDNPMSVEYAQLSSWYVIYMWYWLVVMQDDYDMLRNDRSIRAAVRPPSQSEWKNFLRVDFSVFTEFPQAFAEVALPPGLAYPPPLILRYF